MKRYKYAIETNICYTKLVYGRINNKLNTSLSEYEIEELITAIVTETDESGFQKIGKNIYITSCKRNLRLTVNSFTNRIITVDKLDKIKNPHPLTF
jgi:hypothetical protein